MKDKRKKLREKYLKKTKEKVKESLMSEDMLLGAVAKTIEELQRTANLVGERLEDWFHIYFPELKIGNRRKFVEIAINLDRKKPDEKKLMKILGKGYVKIVKLAKESNGVDLEEKDIEEIRLLAKEIKNMYWLIDRYEKYEEELAKRVVPNISKVAGHQIAAKLIAHCGSLKKLALYPASTIQVLGAEKALFKHLRNKKINPPKHGIIFQHPKISGSPKKLRGKIARALANKISLAAKADAFTGHFIGDKLLKEFEERYKEIITSTKKKRKDRG